MILLAPHHIIHTGAGGPDTLENKATLCLEHHTQVHAGYLVLGTCEGISAARKKCLEIIWHRDEIDEHLRSLIPVEEVEGPERIPMLEMIG